MLYEVEADIREKQLEGQAKLDHRSRHGLPVVEAFFGWIHQQRNRLDLVSSEPFPKALVSIAEREASLRSFLGDPEVTKPFGAPPAVTPAVVKNPGLRSKVEPMSRLPG
jgi:hypothetical protein